MAYDSDTQAPELDAAAMLAETARLSALLATINPSAGHDLAPVAVALGEGVKPARKARHPKGKSACTLEANQPRALVRGNSPEPAKLASGMTKGAKVWNHGKAFDFHTFDIVLADGSLTEIRTSVDVEHIDRFARAVESLFRMWRYTATLRACPFDHKASGAARGLAERWIDTHGRPEVLLVHCLTSGETYEPRKGWGDAWRDQPEERHAIEKEAAKRSLMSPEIGYRTLPQFVTQHTPGNVFGGREYAAYGELAGILKDEYGRWDSDAVNPHDMLLERLAAPSMPIEAPAPIDHPSEASSRTETEASKDVDTLSNDKPEASPDDIEFARMIAEAEAMERMDSIESVTEAARYYGMPGLESFLWLLPQDQRRRAIMRLGEPMHFGRADWSCEKWLAWSSGYGKPCSDIPRELRQNVYGLYWQWLNAGRVVEIFVSDDALRPLVAPPSPSPVTTLRPSPSVSVRARRLTYGGSVMALAA